MALQTKAGLHALIIGVGNYPERPALTQAGAVMSAARFAEWLRTEYRHPDLELRSMKVLLSPVDAAQLAVARLAAGQVDGAASRADVERIVPQWASAYDADPRDAALLYVAGHGSSMVLSGGFLLLEGFGSPGGALAHALNLGFLIEAMGTKRAHANFVFVDACRRTIEEQIAFSMTTGICPLDACAGAPRLRNTLGICHGARPTSAHGRL